MPSRNLVFDLMFHAKLQDNAYASPQPKRPLDINWFLCNLYP